MSTFESFNLSPETLAVLTKLGYSTPTAIQELAIPHLLGDSCDLIGLAATGTGKTLAFGIPMVEKIDASQKKIQALVLCPTRELAMQVSSQLTLVGKAKHLLTATIYGGAGYGDQIRALRAGAQIVVATPGRLIDHMDRGTIKLDGVSMIVLDEADEMISMGFREDLESILSKVTKQESDLPHHTWMFSATMSPPVRRIADTFLKSPKVVQTNRTEMLSGTVEQSFFMTKESDKTDILGKLIDGAEAFYGLIFCQTKALTQMLAQTLQNRGYKADCLHGDKSQGERERILARFKSKELSVLVCTDVAARGLDIKEVSHVINYSIPRELDNYVHRIGRTGRNGQKGIAMSLVTPSHLPLIGRLEKLTKTTIARGVIPTRLEVTKKKLERIRTTVLAAEKFDQLQSTIEETWKETLASMTAVELLARLLVTTQPELANFKKDEPRREASSGGYNQGQQGRGDRSYGGDRGGYGGDRGHGGDRGYGGGRGERTFGGRDRNDRGDRGYGGPDRGERVDRGAGQGAERGAGGDRSDRTERTDRVDRVARPERVDRNVGERGYRADRRETWGRPDERGGQSRPFTRDYTERADRPPVAREFNYATEGRDRREFNPGAEFRKRREGAESEERSERKERKEGQPGERKFTHLDKEGSARFDRKTERSDSEPRTRGPVRAKYGTGTAAATAQKSIREKFKTDRPRKEK